MEVFIQQIIDYLYNLANSIPLPLFGFLGSIVNEVIAPLPSQFVPVTVGLLAQEQGHSFSYLFLVTFVGTIGKTVSTLLTYWIGDKFEDYLTRGKLGKILGIEKNELEKYGQYLDGTRKDDLVLVILRAVPIFPTSIVSAFCGFIKLNIWTYLWTTFVGTYIRFFFFVVVAYEGLRKYSGLLEIIDTTGTVITMAFGLIFSVWFLLFMRKRSDRVLSFLFRNKNQNKETREVK